MAAAAEESREEEKLLQSLAARGWRFRDPTDEAIRSLLRSSPSPSPEDVEAGLVDMDMRNFGGKSLPDRAAAGGSAARRPSYLHGPLVLQVVSVRDIYRSSIDASFKNPQQRRLLRFDLADGHSEVIAIEFCPIPFITEEIAPGTKIRLENKIPINNGILCLSTKNVRVIGGTVQSLYEEWQMSQKYSGLSRPSLRLSQNDDGVGPPPFEKLDIEACSHRTSQMKEFASNCSCSLSLSHICCVVKSCHGHMLLEKYVISSKLGFTFEPAGETCTHGRLGRSGLVLLSVSKIFAMLGPDGK